MCGMILRVKYFFGPSIKKVKGVKKVKGLINGKMADISQRKSLKILHF